MGTSSGRIRAGSSAASAEGRGEGDQQAGAACGSDSANTEQTADFAVLSETVVHRRYLTLYNRAVQFPSIDGSTPVCV